MVATYNILGRQVGSHILAMAVLGATFAGSYASMGGGSKDKKPTPPINAGSEDEEKFIKEFIQAANVDEIKETNAQKH